MHHFETIDGVLHCEGISVPDIAREVGTPFYLYSAATLRHHFQVFDQAFSDLPHITAFAVKACSNLAVLSLLGREGAGADIVSGGELFRALKAGIPAGRIVFAGVGKTGHEIGEALDAGILLFSVESEAELELINQVAGERGAVAPVALRVNPDVDPKTHPYIATGLSESKFGIPTRKAVEAFKQANALPHIRVVGMHQHIGSQITEVAPFVEAVQHAADMVNTLRAAGLTIDYLDIGGGVGIPYHADTAEKPPGPGVMAEAVKPLLKALNVTVITEPGRGIAGNAGIFVTEVLRLKQSGGEKTFVIVDGAMNDLLRPSLYNAHHDVQPVVKPAASTRKVLADVVGPICESGDFLAKNRTLECPAPGDLLAVMSAGAYGFTMASNYNSRPRVAEVLVDGDRFHVVRQRENYDDLIRREEIPWA
ncbi:MAG: diaminopimelate decarboxylase [Nitrospirota bacterium]|nr:diaminopimelate decarboxylase [Nitrospirota bacterium]